MKKHLILFAFVAACLGLSSCATLFSGSKDMVNFTSVPSGASIEIDGVSYGVTPAMVPVKKASGGRTIMFKMDGYQTKYLQTQTTFDAVTILNIFFWPGFLIDAVAGTMNKADPKHYNIILDEVK